MITCAFAMLYNFILSMNFRYEKIATLCCLEIKDCKVLKAFESYSFD